MSTPEEEGQSGFYKNRRVLVSGATGFVGRHLVADLLAEGASVRILVRDVARVPAQWKGMTEVAPGDLESSESLAAACRAVDTVFHAAGYAHAWAHGSVDVEMLQWRINFQGTANLLDAAANEGVRRFVYLSSVKAAGDGGARCIDEDWPVPPDTPYGTAKRAAEQAVLKAGRRHGLHVVNLRPALVYGPDGRGNLERMIKAIQRGWFPPLPDVDNRRSMVHVRDLVRAALLAAQHPAANRQTYNVTDGCTYSSREIQDLIYRGLGKAAPRWAVPAWGLSVLARAGDMLGRLAGRPVGFDSETLDKLLGWACYDSGRIQRELGWRPAFTLAQALPEMLGSADEWKVE